MDFFIPGFTNVGGSWCLVDMRAVFEVEPSEITSCLPTTRELTNLGTEKSCVFPARKALDSE